MQVLVINLDKDTKRMSYMASQLEALGILYERLSAVDGRVVDTSYRYRDDIALLKNGVVLLPGEVGCALSHVMAYERASQYSGYTLVLEDDVELPQNFKQILCTEIDRNKKLNIWEYLSFDYLQPGFPFLKFWLNSIRLNSKKQMGFNKIKFILVSATKAAYIVPMSLYEGVRNWYKKYMPGPVKFYRPLYLAGAYLITNKGAEKMLRLTHPIVYPADKLPNKARVIEGLKFYAYAPVCVRQKKREFGSSILGIKLP